MNYELFVVVMAFFIFTGHLETDGFLFIQRLTCLACAIDMENVFCPLSTKTFQPYYSIPREEMVRTFRVKLGLLLSINISSLIARIRALKKKKRGARTHKMRNNLCMIPHSPLLTASYQ